MADTTDTTLTITITGADVPGLIAKISAMADSYKALADAVTNAVPAIQGSVKEIADAVKATQTNVADALGDLRVDASTIATAIKNFKVL